MKEINPTTPHEYFVDLGVRSPKVPTDEMTPGEREHGHEQFGNNFYLLFVAKQRFEKGTAYEPDLLIEVYLKHAEARGESWKRFLNENRDLLQKIDQAIDGIGPYTELMHHFRDLLFRGREEGSYDLADEFGLLIEPVGVYAWRRLNPLLKEAADEMKKVGIDAKDFFG